MADATRSGVEAPLVASRLYRAVPCLCVHTDKPMESRRQERALEGPVAAVGSGRCEHGSIQVPSSVRGLYIHFLEGSQRQTTDSARMRVRRWCQYFSGRSTVQAAYHRVVSPSTPLSLTTIRRVAVGLRSRAAGRLVVAASRLPRLCIARRASCPGSLVYASPYETRDRVSSSTRAAFVNTASLPARGTRTTASRVFVPWRIRRSLLLSWEVST